MHTDKPESHYMEVYF